MKKKLKVTQTFGLEGIKRHPNHINKTVLILIIIQKIREYIQTNGLIVFHAYWTTW